ncbi:MAG: DUF4325 domain-containing protein [Lachnospiraceae bacterium]|nr:DUF4325 domain-containing protein [Lachnospiraceae bacterium]
MKISEERKKQIIIYLLEKIYQKHESISKTVMEAFDINQNTVHRYINQLVDDGVIRRVKRGQYELVSNVHEYNITKGEKTMVDDTVAYTRYLSPLIQEFGNNVQHIWNYTFSEMMNNVIDHANAEKVSIIVEQNYLSTTAIIVDDGIGIFQKIKEYFNFETLEEAIGELFKGKLTTDAKNHSGEGIFFSSKMMDDFFIVSSGKIFTTNKFDNTRIIDMASENTKGTIVLMKLSNYTNKEAKEVFDLYANVDGGFIRTRIPLKNFFETSPVSRSQAKRVCNRLEKFKEVILDFDGVDWIGQAFAHQLFVVFAKEHQDITLHPENMNQDISKMYNHVLLQ